MKKPAKKELQWKKSSGEKTGGEKTQGGKGWRVKDPVGKNLKGKDRWGKDRWRKDWSPSKHYRYFFFILPKYVFETKAETILYLNYEIECEIFKEK